MVKHLSHVDPFLIAAIRFWIIGLLSTPVSVTLSKYKEVPVFPIGKRTLLLIRSALGATNLMVHFYSLQHLPLADTVMISASSPMFTVFFARIFIKETIKIIDIVNVFLVFGGIVLIVKPPFLFGDSVQMYNDDPEAIYAVIAMVLASVFLQANVYVTLRMLKDVHWSATVSSFGVFGFVQCLTVMLLWGETCLPALGLERLYVVLIGLLSFFAQIGLVVSAQFESATNVALLRKAFDVIFAFIFQILFFHQIPGAFSVVGAMLISMAVLSSGAKKILENLPDEHWLKNNKYLQHCCLGNTNSADKAGSTATNTVDSNKKD